MSSHDDQTVEKSPTIAMTNICLRLSLLLQTIYIFMICTHTCDVIESKKISSDTSDNERASVENMQIFENLRFSGKVMKVCHCHQRFRFAFRKTFSFQKPLNLFTPSHHSRILPQHGVSGKKSILLRKRSSPFPGSYDFKSVNGSVTA